LQMFGYGIDTTLIREDSNIGCVARDLDVQPWAFFSQLTSSRIIEFAVFDFGFCIISADRENARYLLISEFLQFSLLILLEK